MRGGPPPDVVTDLIAFYNDSATTRMQGDVTIPAGTRIEGKLALYGGSLRIAGRVAGPVAVANGTLYLLPGSAVEGEILVVGGRLLRSEQVQHAGPERVYWDAAPVVRGSDGLLTLRERRRPLGEIATARATFQAGQVRTTLSLSTGGTYNRIEGLPVHFGPLFEYRPSPSIYTRLDIRGILRTAGQSTDSRSDFGYVVRGDVRFAGGTEFGLSGRLYSEVEPIEDQPLSIGENGWASFLLQRDYRDYYEQKGISGSAYVLPISTLRLELSLGWDAESSVRASDPWSLFRNSDRWRRNPLIDDGHFFSTGFLAEFDTRNDRDLPTTGWWLSGRYEHLTSDDIAPVALPPVVRPTPPTGRWLWNRPAFLRPQAVRQTHTGASGKRAGPGRRLDCGRSATTAATAIPRRDRPVARVRLPSLYLRAQRIQRSGPASPLRPVDRHPGGGAYPPEAQSGIPNAGPRGQQARPVHRHRRGRSGFSERRRQVLACW